MVAHPFEVAIAALDAFAFPVVAALNGHAIGGGLELALACDLRVAAAGAKLGMPPARLGLIYSHTGLRRFVNAIGAPRTRELFFTARNVTRETALEWGLVNRVVRGRRARGAGVELAGGIAANAPLSLRGQQARDRRAAGGRGRAGSRGRARARRAARGLLPIRGLPRRACARSPRSARHGGAAASAGAVRASDGSPQCGPCASCCSPSPPCSSSRLWPGPGPCRIRSRCHRRPRRARSAHRRRCLRRRPRRCRRAARRTSPRSSGTRRARSASRSPTGGCVDGVQLPELGEDFFTWDPIFNRIPNRPGGAGAPTAWSAPC